MDRYQEALITTYKDDLVEMMRNCPKFLWKRLALLFIDSALETYKECLKYLSVEQIKALPITSLNQETEQKFVDELMKITNRTRSHLMIQVHIEGPDVSGKSIVANMIKQHLEQYGYRIRLIGVGDKTDPYGESSKIPCEELSEVIINEIPDKVAVAYFNLRAKQIKRRNK